MITVEEEGRTADEAVETGVRKLGVRREYVLVEVLDEGSKGFLGLGGRQARVRLTLTPTGRQLVEGRLTLEEMLGRMGVKVEVEGAEVEGTLRFEIRGEDAGLLIGKHGQALESLTFLASKIMGRRLDERVRLEIDVEGYRERRRRFLEEMALRLAEQVKSTGEAVALEPMSSADRRTIHLTLQRDPRVRTLSQGDGLHRRLVIMPAERQAQL